MSVYLIALSHDYAVQSISMTPYLSCSVDVFFEQQFLSVPISVPINFCVRRFQFPLISVFVDLRVHRFPRPWISASVDFRVRRFPRPSISVSVDFSVR